MKTRALLLVLSALLLGGCGGLYTLRVSGWGMNAELAADFRGSREEANRPANAPAEDVPAAPVSE